MGSELVHCSWRHGHSRSLNSMMDPTYHAPIPTPLQISPSQTPIRPVLLCSIQSHIPGHKCYQEVKYKFYSGITKLFFLNQGTMLYQALFEGTTPFNKLWLSFVKRAELDLRLTKTFLFFPLLYFLKIEKQSCPQP